MPHLTALLYSVCAGFKTNVLKQQVFFIKRLTVLKQHYIISAKIAQSEVNKRERTPSRGKNRKRYDAGTDSK